MFAQKSSQSEALGGKRGGWKREAHATSLRTIICAQPLGCCLIKHAEAFSLQAVSPTRSIPRALACVVPVPSPHDSLGSKHREEARRRQEGFFGKW